MSRTDQKSTKHTGKGTTTHFSKAPLNLRLQLPSPLQAWGHFQPRISKPPLNDKSLELRQFQIILRLTAWGTGLETAMEVHPCPVLS